MKSKADISGQFSGLPVLSIPVGLTLYFFNHNFDTEAFLPYYLEMPILLLNLAY